MARFNFPQTAADSLRGMAYAVRNELSGGIAVDDNKYSIRQIEMELQLMVAVVQNEEDELNEANGEMPDFNRVKPFACLRLSDTKDFSCRCTGNGGRFKKAEIPAMLTWKGQPFINYVGNTDMDLAFNAMDGIAQINAQSQYLVEPSYFMANRSIYVALPVDYAEICMISVMGIPEDTTATVNGKCFDAWSTKWSVPAHIKAIAKQRVVGNFGANISNTSQNRDIRNNTNHGNQYTTLQTP